MFIGEMGCWIVVGAFALYRRLTKSKEPSGEYEPVASAEGYPSPPSSPVDEPSPMSKAMAASNAETRIHLKGWKVILLALPACCDIAGTTLMNVGLLFVAASIYQMTRGALVLFVGLFSVVFLRRKLFAYQWFALVLVVLGVGIVGLAGAIFNDDKATPSALAHAADPSLIAVKRIVVEARTPEGVRAIIGVFLIAGAQIFTATQFVLEEYILEHFALEPLKVVGWEGLFGFLVTLLGMVVLYATIGQTEEGRYGYFDAREGLREVTEYRSIAVSSVLIMISIG
jgi:drug/metabolite transporter (DMT)-like permease